METAEITQTIELTNKSPEKPSALKSTEITSDDLCQFILGLPLHKDNLPKILQRLEEDQQKTRKKYDLPPIPMLREDPREYQRRLIEKAKKIGVTILPKIACGSFFEETPAAGAVFISSSDSGSSENKIGVDIKEDSLDNLIRSIKELEHELIHALQNKKYPSMPIEIQEYEAYASGINLIYLQKNPDEIKEIFFDFFIGGSVRTWYKLINEEASKKGLPAVTPSYKR